MMRRCATSVPSLIEERYILMSRYRKLCRFFVILETDREVVRCKSMPVRDVSMTFRGAQNHCLFFHETRKISKVRSY